PRRRRARRTGTRSRAWPSASGTPTIKAEGRRTIARRGLAGRSMTNAKSRGGVAYLGPAGTYSHAAVLKYFGQEQACLPMGEIPEVFACVAEGRSEFGVVPVENSSEGSVALTLDCFSGSELRICGEVLLRINHFLLAAPGTRAADITRIVSHPQS